MDAKYYPRDGKRVKERVFESETGKYEHDGLCCEFNELSRFAPTQVATEEMKKDHFE